jgi:hypothetical protein
MSILHLKLVKIMRLRIVLFVLSLVSFNVLAANVPTAPTLNVPAFDSSYLGDVGSSDVGAALLPRSLVEYMTSRTVDQEKLYNGNLGEQYSSSRSCLSKKISGVSRYPVSITAITQTIYEGEFS